MTNRLPDMLLWIVAATLLLQAVACVAVGGARALAPDGLLDMRRRFSEYSSFRDGIYPDPKLAGAHAGRGIPLTVYLPYAMPMFSSFFEPGGLRQGVFLVEALSLVALVGMGWYGWQSLRFAGRPWAALGAVSGAAIAGNATVFQLGQLSILCVGLIVLQLTLLDRRRQGAAGLCWALAMIKPQIAASFAILFLVERQWRGLLFGLTILASLTLVALWWTGVSLERMVHHWMFGMPMHFTTNAQGLGPGPLAARFGFDPRVAQGVAILVMIVSAAAAWWFVRRQKVRIDMPALAGVTAVLGELFLYHYHYDNVMLAPTVLGLLRIAASVRSAGALILLGLMMTTVYLPHGVIANIPWSPVLRAVIWSAAAVVLLADSVGRLPRRHARHDGRGYGTSGS